MRSFLFFITVIFFLPCSAQNNQLYGISRNSNPNVTYLATVDASNGFINDVSSNSYAVGVANFSFTVDPNADIYYFTDSNSLIGIDLNTGTLVHQNPITTSQGTIFQNFIYNELTQEIIGIERGGASSGVYLSKIDPTTGVVTAISTTPFANTSAINMAGSALDLRRQWYHIFSQDRILSVDINTGAVVHNPLFDTTDFAYFNNLFFNPVNQKLYAIGRNSNPAELFLTQINPITGAVTTVSPTSIGIALELEGSALDPVNGIYYCKRVGVNGGNVSRLAGIDVITGLEVSSTSFDFSQSNGAYFGHFYYGGPTVQLLSNEDQLSSKAVTLYPNPTVGSVTLEGDSISQILLYSLTGKLLLDRKYGNEQSVQLDVKDFNDGVYLMKVFHTDESSESFKLIKN
ncbi:T9SS type A sorting domain-containing protein [Nonlabens sp.]|uniref:T9SS type A sorting domain-containing protein n=1 Tax=Nonlabens sp. TaxID=1888209 RepID=UPI003F69A067